MEIIHRISHNMKSDDSAKINIECCSMALDASLNNLNVLGVMNFVIFDLHLPLNRKLLDQRLNRKWQR